MVFLCISPNFVEIINYLFSIFSTIHEASFDSLPPGEKYHIPPNETHSSHNSQDILQEEVEHQEDEDPFDTSGIILPETSNVTMPSSTRIESNESESSVSVPPMLAQLAAFITPPQHKNSEINNDENDFSEFTNFRRGIPTSYNDPDTNLPQLTSPLSPPAFNPNEINLGTVSKRCQ